MRRIATFLLMLCCVSSAQAQVITPGEMLRSSVTNFIRPQVKAFAVRTDALTKAVGDLCATPGETTLATARTAFGAAAAAYGGLEILRIGPLVENSRADRILFFPDRRGIGLRQVQQILGSEDAAAAELTGLQSKSVAVQGLGALEFTLFGTGAETLAATGQTFRCRYSLAIAQNLAQIADEIVAGWADPDGIAKHLTQPEPGNSDFRTTTESLEAIIGLASHGIEAIRDTRLLPTLAKGSKKPNPRLALFWRSGLTTAMLRANLDGIQRLITLSGATTDANLASQIDAAFRRALDALAKVTSPIEAAVSDPAQAAGLGEVVAATQDLQRLVGEELSSQLGLSVGFSSLDGD